MFTFSLVILFISIYMIAHNFLALVYISLYLKLYHDPSVGRKGEIKSISIIMPVFNEEKNIVRKMDNLHEALSSVKKDYEVLIGSDGSEDATCDEVEKYIRQNRLANWHVFRYDHEGKGRAINKLVKSAKGELIISTDADTRMEKEALSVIISRFEQDEKVGCLSCVPVFRGKNLRLQSLYWKFETKMRDAESALGKLIVVTGWLYAYRRKLFKEIPDGAMADDLWIPLTILLQGYSSVHARELLGLSEKTSEGLEVKRRKRVIAGGADIIRRLFRDIIKDPMLLFLVFSHKVNKWLLSLWVILILISSLLIYPNSAYLYGVLALALLIYFRPRRFFYLLESIFSPVFSIGKAFASADLSKWRHTRES